MINGKEIPVKKANMRLIDSLSPASGEYVNGTAIVGAVAIAVAAMMGLSFLATPLTHAQNLGSPNFANPSEVRDRPKEKRLRAVIELTSGQYQIPNVGMENLRQFRGWDADQPKPNFGPEIAPGPTLRMRLGDLVEISFYNKVDDNLFPYTFDTSSPPGFSGFGCDQVGTSYPGVDKFPNCFHGSSTANLHFHGTHTSPDGVGDDVLVQVLPQVKQPDWTSTFKTMFDSGKIPQTWADMPKNYQTQQLQMIGAYDKQAAADAAKNNLKAPASLLQADLKMINAGQWPQYLMGAFPNFFEVPDYASGRFKMGQAPGTHWYHAHKHGSTSLHSLNGMSGAIIIESTQEGGYDQVIRKFYGWGDTYGDHEKVIFLQEYDTTLNAVRAGPNGKEQMLVNGKLSPTLTMRPGEVQLWRVVNATVGDTFVPLLSTLQAKGFVFKQTAQDGVQFSPANYSSQPFLSGQFPGGMTLSTGNRADLLVQAPPTAVGVVPVINNDGSNANVLFVNVTGEAVTQPNGPFPTVWAEMPKFLWDLPKPGPYDITNPGSPVKFQQISVQGELPHFMINNKQFEETGPVVDQCMPANGLQDWVLENYTTSAAHPFHIHVNPFQIIEIDTPTGLDTYSKYTPANNYIWQDVIAIPIANVDANNNVTPGRIIIRQTYPDFIGTFVLHCHILPHEDRGMMQLVRIVPAALYPMACQGNIPQHH
jgi:FtsP/CotA-like multicopper oxidase with cupredoxin domain